jgi:hypothetical protein
MSMMSDLSPFEMTSLGKRESRMLQRYLGDLSLSVGAKDAFIADLSGHLWLSSATEEEYDQETFTVVLATGMGAAVEMMNVLDDSRGTSIFLHEGERYVFSAAHVEQEMVLGLIFEQGSEHRHIGNLYSSMKQAVGALRKVIIKKEPPAEATAIRQECVPFPEAAHPLVDFDLAETGLPVAPRTRADQAPTLLSYQEAADLGLLNLDLATH